MMTKEEVAQVIAYCDENKISYKQRLAELGINPWNFYDAKRKYAPKQEGESSGEFLQLVPGGLRLNKKHILNSFPGVKGSCLLSSCYGSVVTISLLTHTQLN